MFGATAVEHRHFTPERIRRFVARCGDLACEDFMAALRRHATSPLTKAPAELVDRLADHFLR